MFLQSGVGRVCVDVSIKERNSSSLLWIGVCFKQTTLLSLARWQWLNVAVKRSTKQLPASLSHYLLNSLRNNPHCFKKIVLYERKTTCFTLSGCGLQSLETESAIGVCALSIETVKIKLHKGRLIIDNFLFFVSLFLSLYFLWLTVPFCLQLFCVCHKSASDLDLCSGCSKGLWAHRAVKNAPYFFSCSVKEVARHDRIVTSLLWWCFTDVDSHACHYKNNKGWMHPNKYKDSWYTPKPNLLHTPFI